MRTHDPRLVADLLAERIRLASMSISPPSEADIAVIMERGGICLVDTNRSPPSVLVAARDSEGYLIWHCWGSSLASFGQLFLELAKELVAQGDGDIPVRGSNAGPAASAARRLLRPTLLSDSTATFTAAQTLTILGTS